MRSDTQVLSETVPLQDTTFRVRVNLRVENAKVFLISQYALKYKYY